MRELEGMKRWEDAFEGDFKENIEDQEIDVFFHRMVEGGRQKLEKGTRDYRREEHAVGPPIENRETDNMENDNDEGAEHNPEKMTERKGSNSTRGARRWSKKRIFLATAIFIILATGMIYAYSNWWTEHFNESMDTMQSEIAALRNLGTSTEIHALCTKDKITFRLINAIGDEVRTLYYFEVQDTQGRKINNMNMKIKVEGDFKESRFFQEWSDKEASEPVVEESRRSDSPDNQEVLLLNNIHGRQEGQLRITESSEPLADPSKKVKCILMDLKDEEGNPIEGVWEVEAVIPYISGREVYDVSQTIRHDDETLYIDKLFCYPTISLLEYHYEEEIGKSPQGKDKERIEDIRVALKKGSRLLDTMNGIHMKRKDGEGIIRQVAPMSSLYKQDVSHVRLLWETTTIGRSEMKEIKMDPKGKFPQKVSLLGKEYTFFPGKTKQGYYGAVVTEISSGEEKETERFSMIFQLTGSHLEGIYTHTSTFSERSVVDEKGKVRFQTGRDYEEALAKGKITIEEGKELIWKPWRYVLVNHPIEKNAKGEVLGSEKAGENYVWADEILPISKEEARQIHIYVEYSWTTKEINREEKLQIKTKSED